MKRALLILCALCGSVYAATSEVVVKAESFARVVADAAPGQTLVLTDGVYRDVEGQAKPGAQPAGVEIERVAVLPAQRVAEFKAAIAPILAAMLHPGC